MSYLLDTNAVIALMKGDPAFLTRLRARRPQDFFLSAIVEHELFYGAYKSQRVTENLARVAALQFEVLPFDSEDAQASGRIRAVLGSEGTPIGPYDVLIAGQALARGLVLITRNLREFQRVPGLMAEEWQGG
ncbi:type II toxin-antitoxin system VapC family toxin [Lacibacterium aquatile]|uniref:Ribonuclease VapC n=1 Tax=Lacibacterium aquatile TaxID=1168082 RepID=A0ABW5DP18_9PROT